jgi:hypothetical protein
VALVILEGLDRTGKSSVAEHYKSQGYELVHQSAPAKGTTPDLYLEEQMGLVSAAAHKDIVLDRSYYGELVWPQVYGRESLLPEDSLDVLREIENQVGTTRIMMVDNNVEAHWKRCVDNKEPLTKPQFVRARTLFSKVADDSGFERRTLADYPELFRDAVQAQPVAERKTLPDEPVERGEQLVARVSAEQQKLEYANAINDVLSKRILKSKGPIYDKLEDTLRVYLNSELGKIFGTKAEAVSPSQFSKDEVELLKFFCGKLKEGKR